jgi:putative FmdB family regulatory protein
MPTYEYQCEKCGSFEQWQSIKDAALQTCPTCGSPVKRLVSANVGFILKGSGFYQNDYKNKNNTNLKEKTSTPAVPTETHSSCACGTNACQSAPSNN